MQSRAKSTSGMLAMHFQGNTNAESWPQAPSWSAIVRNQFSLPANQVQRTRYCESVVVDQSFGFGYRICNVDNGIEDNFLNTAFFPLDMPENLDIPPLQAFADIADQSSEMYIKAEEGVVCRADRTTAVLKLYDGGVRQYK